MISYFIILLMDKFKNLNEIIKQIQQINIEACVFYQVVVLYVSMLLPLH